MLYVNPHSAPSFQAGKMAPGSDEREAEALKQFEQLFIYQMMKEMRKTVPKYGVVDNAQRAYFDEMMDDFLAGEVAASGQFGIAGQLADQIASRTAQAGSKSDFSAGIEVNAEPSGIPLVSHSPAGLPIVPPKRGIALYESVATGIQVRDGADSR